MKVIVALALLVVATNAGPARGLCKKAGALNPEAFAEVKSAVLSGTSVVFGHCDHIDAVALFFTEGGACKPLFQQGFCYGQLAQNYYGGKTVVSYADLAGDVDNIQSLGKTSCAHGRDCFNELKRVFMKCDEDSDFRQGVIDAVEGLYREHGEAIVKQWTSAENSLLAEAATLLRNRFTSVDDIASAIDDFLAEDISDDIISDAKAAFAELDAAAQKWCDEGCSGPTGTFLKGLFNGMHGEGCTDASGFCGDCADRADAYLASHSIPCCLDNAIEKGIEGINYVKDTYADALEDLQDRVSEQLSEDALALAENYIERITAQVLCLKGTYDASSNDCA